MKLTKATLKQFIEDWETKLDETDDDIFTDDILHALSEKFNLYPNKPKTLMEIFANEDMKNIPTVNLGEIPF